MTTKPMAAKPTASALVRQRIRELLAAAPAYSALPADRQRDIARDTIQVATYLVDPDGLMAQEFRQPLLAGVVGLARWPGPIDTLQVPPGVADGLIAAVDFPTFVSQLIKGVFNAIVDASIQQMEAYAELIRAAAASVDRFVEDGISEAAARDTLVAEFPDVFCWSAGQPPRLQLHAAAGSAALLRLADAIGLREPVADPKRYSEVARIVAAARRRIARNRQQLLATMLLLGVNRSK